MMKDQLQSRFCLIIKVNTGVPVHENEAMSTTRKQMGHFQVAVCLGFEVGLGAQLL